MAKDAFGKNRKPLIIGNWMIDPVRAEVKLYGTVINDLTALEIEMLYFLASHKSQEWTRTDMLNTVWGQEYVGDPRVVDVHIGQLRRKIAIIAGDGANLDDLGWQPPAKNHG